MGGNPLSYSDPLGLDAISDQQRHPGRPATTIDILLSINSIVQNVINQAVNSSSDILDNKRNNNDVLIRRGRDWESTTRLAKQCEAAEKAGAGLNEISFGYGVSVTTSMQSNFNLAKRFGRDPEDFSTGVRSLFTDAGFEVRDTPVKNDKYHKTVVFPKPVTPEMASKFNQLLGRTKR